MLHVRRLSYCAVGNYADNESRSRNLVNSENLLCYLVSLQTFHICTRHLQSLKEEFENRRARFRFLMHASMALSVCTSLNNERLPAR